MLTIQNLLKQVYCYMKHISKKTYRNYAVLVSGFAVFALISLNMHGFKGAGKNRNAAACSSLPGMEEETQEEKSRDYDFLGGNFAAACRQALETEEYKIKAESIAQIKKRETTAVCASVEPVYNEIQQEPVNPYGAVSISDVDYDALCRIVQAEAGGEDEQGKILVAEVILNRVLTGEFASTVYGVIFERSGGSPQFAPTADGRYYTVEVTPETVEAVEKAIHGEDLSQGALFFSARSKADPNDMAWFDRNLKWLFQYGGHEFYTLP